jgi:hypothetical protein
MMLSREEPHVEAAKPSQFAETNWPVGETGGEYGGGMGRWKEKIVGIPLWLPAGIPSRSPEDCRPSRLQCGACDRRRRRCGLPTIISLMPVVGYAIEPFG